MKEDLLQFIWQFGKYNSKLLKTTDGESLTILFPGHLNHHAGPDFLDARIKIGDTEWAGNVEIHINAKDWFLHKHHNDEKYKSVILHVVYNNDAKNFHRPTLELKNRVSNSLLSRYQQIMNNQLFVPCQNFLADINPFTWITWKERLFTERLEEKTERISNSLKQTNNDWQQIFYEQLAYNFGLKSNELAFEELAKRVSLKTVAKHKNSLFQIEALLFGTSGLIKNPVDEYSNKLLSEFLFLQKKYAIKVMSETNWNFGRIRPPSLPTNRIAQLAALLHQSSALFSKILSINDFDTIKQYFDTQVSDYWTTHYVFNKTSTSKISKIGRAKIENIIINTIVPFKFIYGKLNDKSQIVEDSMQLLNHLPYEKNKIINQWQNYLNVKSAYESQALLYLYNNYCTKKRCLNCRIGHEIFAKK